MEEDVESGNGKVKFPKEWCRFQHRQLANRYNIIPMEVKEANFTKRQRVSLFFTHFSIRFTRKIVVIFAVILAINIVWKQIISRYQMISNHLLNELEFVLWTAMFIAILLNLSSKFIQNRVVNGDYLFNENTVLLISCESCKRSGITKEFDICRGCNSLGFHIGNWQQETILEKLKENPRWGMD